MIVIDRHMPGRYTVRGDGRSATLNSFDELVNWLREGWSDRYYKLDELNREILDLEKEIVELEARD